MSVPGGFFAALRSSSGGPFPGASLYLNLLSGTSLDSRVTFSRGGNATLVDSTGRIVYAPANLLLRSEEFNDANWQKLFTSVTANTTAAPDNNTTADTLTASATTAEHVLLSAVGMGVSILAGVTYAISIYVKAGTSSFIQINGPTSFGADAFANFNVATGTVGTVGSAATAAIQNVGNGWYRCSMVAPALVASGRVNFTMTTSATAPRQESWTATGTETLFVWGAQLEPVTYQTVPGPYVATTSAAYYGPRFDYNPVTLAPLGLLIEEQRTNLVLRSQEFNIFPTWQIGGTTAAANTTTSPDGTVNADRVTASATLAGHFIFQDLTTTAAAHTFSAYVKYTNNRWILLRIFDGTTNYFGSFDILNGVVGAKSAAATTSITPAGNGWYRAAITVTTLASTGSNVLIGLNNSDTASIQTWTPVGTETVDVWGAQFEVGSFATSYIPTVASQVTRLADVATMTGTNFSSWFNPTVGTFFADADAVLSGVTRGIVGNVTGIYPSYVRSTNAGSVFDGGNIAATANLITAAPFRLATTYGGVLLEACLQGGTVATATYNGNFGGMTSIALGSSGAGAAFLNGHIRQIAYFNTRLPNAQLEALTAPPLITSLSLDFLNGVYEG